MFCKERTNSASNTTENSVVYKLFFYALLQQNKYGEEESNNIIHNARLYMCMYMSIYVHVYQLKYINLHSVRAHSVVFKDFLLFTFLKGKSIPLFSALRSLQNKTVRNLYVS